MPEFDNAVTQTIAPPALDTLPYTITDFERDISAALTTMANEAVTGAGKFATAMAAACHKAKDAALPKHLVAASMDNAVNQLESLSGKIDDAMGAAFPEIKDFI